MQAGKLSTNNFIEEREKRARDSSKRERDVKPNQFKLLTHCDCFFQNLYTQKKKVKTSAKQNRQTYRGRHEKANNS